MAHFKTMQNFIKIGLIPIPSNAVFQVLTKDSVTVSVDAVVYYRVSNATVSVANVENAHHSTRLLAQTTLRNILGTKNLHEILSDRESISGSMQVKPLSVTTNVVGLQTDDAGHLGQNSSAHVGRPRHRFANWRCCRNRNPLKIVNYKQTLDAQNTVANFDLP